MAGSVLDTCPLSAIIFVADGLGLPHNILQGRPPRSRTLPFAGSERHLPSVRRQHRLFWAFQYYDISGSILLLLGLSLFCYAITASNELGWQSTPVLSTITSSVLVLALFGSSQFLQQQPLFRLKSTKNFFILHLLIANIMRKAVYFAVLYFLVQQLQSHGKSTILTAACVLPFVFADIALAIGTSKIGSFLDERYIVSALTLSQSIQQPLTHMLLSCYLDGSSS